MCSTSIYNVFLIWGLTRAFAMYRSQNCWVVLEFFFNSFLWCFGFDLDWSPWLVSLLVMNSIVKEMITGVWRRYAEALGRVVGFPYGAHPGLWVLSEPFICSARRVGNVRKSHWLDVDINMKCSVNSYAKAFLFFSVTSHAFSCLYPTKQTFNISYRLLNLFLENGNKIYLCDTSRLANSLMSL